MRHERPAMVCGSRAGRFIFLAACLSVLLFSATPMMALDPSIANTQYGLSSWMADDGLPHNGVAAIAQTPDGYLWFATDLILPDMDGFAVVNVLRESSSLGRVALLVYSALDVGNADQARLRLGPTEFLTKSRCGLADFERHLVRLLDTVTSTTVEDEDAA